MTRSSIAEAKSCLVQNGNGIRTLPRVFGWTESSLRLAAPMAYVDSLSGRVGTLPAGLSNEFVERWSVLFEQVLRPAVVIVDRREFRIDSQIVIQRRVNFRIRHRS